MADGRCFTVNTSAQLFNNYVKKEQGKGNCNTCDKPLLKVPDIY
jgi:ribosomal protein L34E